MDVTTYNMTTTTLANAADWHATMALKAYRKRDYENYTRHIRIADNLRAIEVIY
jgi:hypothetical protein